MVNLTPGEVKGDYLLYPEKEGVHLDAPRALEAQMEELGRCGRTGSLERGDALPRRSSSAQERKECS